MIWNTERIRILEKWKTYWYRTHPTELAEYTWTYLFSGGKELRARLFCELWSYLSPDCTPNAELAFAIECIHVASLILDDTPWMDDASTRRGRLTLHRMYSDKKALLIAYDVLRMVEQIWREQRPSHIKEQEWNTYFCSKMERLMIGQWYDLEGKGTLYELASLKTGVLFELVTETVARCTHLDAPFWASWGNHLGILFQWADDWYDREQDLHANNRNAFNEAYEWTYEQYGEMWKQLCNEIGPSWFDRPLGKELRAYFTVHVGRDDLETVSFHALLPTTTRLPLPSPPIGHDLVDSQGLMKHLFSILLEVMIEHTTILPMLTTNLWDIPEEEWSNVPEIIEWLHRIEHTKTYHKKR